MVQVGYTDINLANTGKDYPMLAGNLASILISMFVCVAVSLIKPDEKPYDWESTRNLAMVEEEFTGGWPKFAHAWRSNPFNASHLQLNQSNMQSAPSLSRIAAHVIGSWHVNELAQIRHETRGCKGVHQVQATLSVRAATTYLCCCTSSQVLRGLQASRKRVRTARPAWTMPSSGSPGGAPH